MFSAFFFHFPAVSYLDSLACQTLDFVENTPKLSIGRDSAGRDKTVNI